MTLYPPFEISPSLKPSLRIGGAWVCLELTGRYSGDGRAIYQWSIILPDGTEHSGDDLKSGCAGGDLLEGFKSLLSFLGACAEAMRYARHKRQDAPWNDPDSNASLFPEAVALWCDECGSDAFSMLELELEEAEGDLIEA